MQLSQWRISLLFLANLNLVPTWNMLMIVREHLALYSIPNSNAMICTPPFLQQNTQFCLNTFIPPAATYIHPPLSFIIQLLAHPVIHMSGCNLFILMPLPFSITAM